MFVKELEWRGLIQQTSSPELAEIMGKESLTLFAGFDPTADSLHVGHLLPLICLKRAAILGHHPIALIGGATGLIGDPSGKSTERQLLTREAVQANVDAIAAQIKRLIPEAEVINNIDWFDNINVLDFLRHTGKHFSINTMLARDAVKSRLVGEKGISFTEFTYMLLQAFDFLHLNRTVNCRLQIGGSDQWGNISSGIDLIRRDGREAFGLTLPLLTNSNGEKFGKTVHGAVWLDASKTTAHDMFQFFFNTTDENVIKLLKLFTFISSETIAELAESTAFNPAKRAAQLSLAKHVCQFVHGSDGTEIPKLHVGVGSLLVDALVRAKACVSRNDARSQIKQRAVKINDIVVIDTERKIFNEDLTVDSTCTISKGKRWSCKLFI
jgi:tyrosyl-tRNA synthetase